MAWEIFKLTIFAFLSAVLLLFLLTWLDTNQVRSCMPREVEYLRNDCTNMGGVFWTMYNPDTNTYDSNCQFGSTTIKQNF